ncbi:MULTISPECIES: nucleoside hydrolase [unclassified Micromonospora]|uniref:nucleoside hydrolase n=1 Tax=unclassified Micromonospora TaxID=2617518 RepID=UPI003A83BA3F
MDSRRHPLTVPRSKRIRLVVDSDARNEADDQYAIVHALLTPRFDMRGLVGAHFGVRNGLDTAAASVAEIHHLLELMRLPAPPPVTAGVSRPLRDAVGGAPGVDLIVAEAMRDDPLPLFVAFLGPLTDLAAALRVEPRIAGRLTAVWIGGGPYPDGGAEFNLGNDVDAANEVFDSEVELWQIPNAAYGMMRVGLSELAVRVAPRGPVGAYLFRQLVELNDAMGDNANWPAGESWVLGDSPAVGVLLDEHWMDHRQVPAPIVLPDLSYQQRQDHSRTIRVYHRIDSRFVLEDLYAKLTLAYG